MITKAAREWLSYIGQRGGKRAAEGMTKAQRIARAKKARAARNGKPKR